MKPKAPKKYIKHRFWLNVVKDEHRMLIDITGELASGIRIIRKHYGSPQEIVIVKTERYERIWAPGMNIQWEPTKLFG